MPSGTALIGFGDQKHLLARFGIFLEELADAGLTLAAL